MGQFDAAIAEIKRAQELDPLSLIINTDAGWIFYLARRYDQAIEQCRKTLEVDSQFTQAHHWLVCAYVGKGMFAEALADIEKLSLSDDALWIQQDLGYLYGMMGKKYEARGVLANLKEQARRRYVAPICFVVVYIGLGGEGARLRPSNG